MDYSSITDYNIERSETTKHTTANTLVDQSKPLGKDKFQIQYDSTDFRLYFDRMLASLDEFTKVYILLLLKANGTYDHFPDGRSYSMDFTNIEHAIGISSFGNSDTVALDFMADLLASIHITPPSVDTQNAYANDEATIIDTIITTWDSDTELSDQDIMDAIIMIQKYKDVDDVDILRKIEKLATIVLETSYSTKRRNKVKYIPNGKREKEIMDDLIAFIENELTPNERRILFSMDFKSLRTYETTTVPGPKKPFTKYIDQSDEKQFVLGKISSYLMSKYDKDLRETKHGFDLFQLITKAKERYYDYYTEQLILRNMSNNPKTIKKSIKSYIDDTNNDHFKKTISKFINNKPKIQLKRSNIKTYLELINKDNLNIETMILLYNMGLNIEPLIVENQKELDILMQKEIELEEKKEEIIKKLEDYYKSNKELAKESFETYINNILRGIIKKGANPLEKQLFEINKELTTVHTKYKSSEEYQEQLEAYKEKMSGYDERIELKIKKLLEDYSNGTIDIFAKNNDFLRNFIIELLHNNYLPIVIDRIDKINQTPPIINSETKPLLEIMHANPIEKLRMQTIELGKIKEITKKIEKRITALAEKKTITDDEKAEIKSLKEFISTLKGLDYEQSKNDVDFAISLVSKIKDRRMINLAHQQMQIAATTSSNRREIIKKVLKTFKNNTDDSSIIYLVHALLHHKDVQALLETRFIAKSGTEFNYDKISYKCLSLLPLGEIVSSRVKVSETIGSYNLSKVPISKHSDINTKMSSISHHSPFLMYLGGGGEPKSIVYLEFRTTGGSLKLVPVHSIRYEVEGKLSYEMTADEVIKEGKYIPTKRIDSPVESVLIDAGEPSTINRRIII